MLALALILVAPTGSPAQQDSVEKRLTIARVIYEGGGDWYSNPSSLPNLLEEIRTATGLPVDGEEVQLSLKSPELFNYPYLYINGHGNISFDEQEVRRLRKYLDEGGFLHADDNYGMDESFRREMKKVYPEADFIELPFDFPIYHSVFDFPGGMPKVHEHDGGPPQGLGLFSNGRLVVFYSLNTDLGDGWEDRKVHDDPEEIRQQALRMGVNIFVYAIGSI
ncbi:MAG: DUF4159 domain-containing protein [Candidatus Glassbacteria bacterium]|nr:DUF4159 domain-containing protein [Candidatus Glassbacteria bacterium]